MQASNFFTQLLYTFRTLRLTVNANELAVYLRVSQREREPIIQQKYRMDGVLNRQQETGTWYVDKGD